jgi:heat-inducible transcriptional repressor
MAELISRLTQRQRSIILNLVRIYVRQAHPVSSNALVEFLNLSSATIRNELGYLEELGFVSKEHQASGRTPTDLAYRFFVDEVRASLESDPNEHLKTEKALMGLEREFSQLISWTLTHLSKQSGQAAWLSMPVLPDLKLRSVDFIPTAERSFLILVVTTKGYTKHKMVTLGQPLDPQILAYLKEQLNNYLSGKDINEIDMSQIRRIFREVRRLPHRVIESVTGFLDELGQGIERMYISDSRPLLSQPEFRDAQLMNRVLDALNDKESFNTYVRDVLGDQEFSVVIGRENLNSNLEACGLVLSRYYLPGSASGTVGVIGPMRQTYDLNIPLVVVVAECLSELFTREPLSL